MTQDSQRAKEIYQQLLDEIGTAIVDKDGSRYASHFSFPHKLQTFDTVVVIEDSETLERYFYKLVDRMIRLSVPELVRYCTIAEFVDPDTIRGCHQTRLINHDLILVEDYMALSTLTFFDGVWKVSASQYAEATPSLPTRISQ